MVRMIITLRLQITDPHSKVFDSEIFSNLLVHFFGSQLTDVRPIRTRPSYRWLIWTINKRIQFRLHSNRTIPRLLFIRIQWNSKETVVQSDKQERLDIWVRIGRQLLDTRGDFCWAPLCLRSSRVNQYASNQLPATCISYLGAFLLTTWHQTIGESADPSSWSKAWFSFSQSRSFYMVL